jgi:RNA polymerase sigma-70 factor (ECF subfamily)
VVPLDELEVADTPQAGEPGPAVDREELERGLNALSPEHCEALVLRYFEEMDYEEIALATGCSPGTVRSRIHYGKQALRKLLKGTPI